VLVLLLVVLGCSKLVGVKQQLVSNNTVREKQGTSTDFATMEDGHIQKPGSRKRSKKDPRSVWFV